MFQGKQPFDTTTDQAVRKLYAVWLGYSRMFVDEAEHLPRTLRVERLKSLRAELESVQSAAV